MYDTWDTYKAIIINVKHFVYNYTLYYLFLFAVFAYHHIRRLEYDLHNAKNRVAEISE